jgi:hypothetical protein
MKTVFFVALALSSFGAFANPIPGLTDAQPVCYGREYSKSHLSKHPKQTVRQMKLKFSKEAEHHPSVLMKVDAEIRREVIQYGEKVQIYKPYSTAMSCTVNGSKLECGIDCDGGHASVNFAITNAKNEILFKNEGFVMYGGCGDEADEMIFLQATKGGDDIFKLYPLPKEYCQQ